MVCCLRCTHATEGEELGREINSIGLVNLTTSDVKMFDMGIYDTPYPLLNHVESLLIEEL